VRGIVRAWPAPRVANRFNARDADFKAAKFFRRGAA